MDVIKFKLADKSGKMHDYIMTPHKASQAQGIVLRINACIPEIMMPMLDASQSDKSLKSLMDTDLDLGKMAAGVSQALMKLDGDFLRSLFVNTTRDGKELSEDAYFDHAYTANYAEWAYAIYKIVDANGFLAFLSMLGEGPSD